MNTSCISRPPGYGNLVTFPSDGLVKITTHTGNCKYVIYGEVCKLSNGIKYKQYKK